MMKSNVHKTPWDTCSALEQGQNSLGGYKFKGFEVSLSDLLLHVTKGGTAQEFLILHPEVKPEQLQTVLKIALKSFNSLPG